METLKGVEPKKVFHYFEEICRIPHGSGNTKRISDYCVSFAKDRGIRYIQDDSNNVILFKDGSSGYECSAPVIIQGHLDMVCEKDAGCPVNFEKDGLRLRTDGVMIWADGTTLGGDDGIAVAFALAILDSDDLEHPPLEIVLTTDEEVGMLGASALDCTFLKGRTMLNLDSEEEGVLLVSCAGGISAACHLPAEREDAEGVWANLKIKGLTGGHSGVEIDRGRANANRLLGRMLNEMGKNLRYSLVSVFGGLKDNAIPREAFAELVIREEDLSAVKTFVETYRGIFGKEFRSTDPELSVEISIGEKDTFRVMTDRTGKGVVAALTRAPAGVQKMSADIPGLVQTSLNMGTLKTLEEEVEMIFSVRSSVGTEKNEVVSRLEKLTEALGGTIECSGDYPAWEYKKDSRLRELMVEVFKQQYGREPEVQAIHAGLECGLFAGKLPGLDCISFGPDIFDIHTTSERLDIDSVRRTWRYVLEILRRLK